MVEAESKKKLISLAKKIQVGQGLRHFRIIICCVSNVQTVMARASPQNSIFLIVFIFTFFSK